MVRILHADAGFPICYLIQSFVIYLQGMEVWEEKTSSCRIWYGFYIPTQVFLSVTSSDPSIVCSKRFSLGFLRCLLQDPVLNVQARNTLRIFKVIFKVIRLFSTKVWEEKTSLCRIWYRFFVPAHYLNFNDQTIVRLFLCETILAGIPKVPRAGPSIECTGPEYLKNLGSNPSSLESNRWLAHWGMRRENLIM